MFILSEKWKPILSIEGTDSAGGVDSTDGGSSTPPPDTGSHDGPGSGRSGIRKSLEDGFAKAHRDTDEQERPEKREPSRRQPKTPDRVGARLSEMPDSGSGDQTETDEQVAGQTDDDGEENIPTSQPPASWDAKAKAVWNDLPAEAQTAALKRELDVERGVKALRDKYAEVDQALAPHIPAIQQHGHTPAQAITQLFSWFDALGKNPRVAFPALAASFGYDLRQFIPRPPQQPQAPAAGQPGQAPATPATQPQFAPVDPKYVQWNKQQFEQVKKQNENLEQQLQAINQSKTEENVAIWSRDKPHFEAVREHMAYLIGSGAVPLRDGKVDLDGAYDQAIWGVPQVRAIIQHEQAVAAQSAAKAKRDAERKAQSEQAEKARRLAGGLPIQAPGIPPASGKDKKGPQRSVRDTLLDAVKTHRPE